MNVSSIFICLLNEPYLDGHESLVQLVVVILLLHLVEQTLEASLRCFHIKLPPLASPLLLILSGVVGGKAGR